MLVAVSGLALLFRQSCPRTALIVPAAAVTADTGLGYVNGAPVEVERDGLSGTGAWVGQGRIRPASSKGWAMGFVVSIVVFTVGAVLRFATNVRSATWNIQAIGDILMIVGVVGFVLAAVAWAYWDGPAFTRRRSVYHHHTSSAPPVYGPDGYARTTYGSPSPTVLPVSTPEPTRPVGTVVEEEEERSVW